ncbi:interleukin-15 receptor subunit alpha isoform X1 [Salmo salar]|uniref:Interleukin-15 receptor subunit alpha isoform X1 n=1 Tax=Salmo salar TaxID=8030 RepID=A0A1S3SG99_SALSA|nr:interleukin-15 receptor subunit alpha isoform X1 [Salmo salar]|eukprot:XP_014063370.1 PREDICTED: interleukin-15 receptor subunit alpha isoform X4 [Salmo salar]
MRLRLLSLLLIVKVCRLNTVSRDVCPPLPQWKLTKPLNPKHSNQENTTLRYQCVDGYVRKAGTSNLIKCKRTGLVLEWTRPTLTCIPDPSIPTTIEFICSGELEGETAKGGIGFGGDQRDIPAGARATASTTHKTTPFLTTHLSVPTERVSPRPTILSSPLSQTLHPVTETQVVITTVTVTTTIIDDITSVPVDKSSVVTSVSTKTVSPSESYCVSNRAPTFSEDPVGDRSTATAIYAGVGGVVVTILLVAAFGVLMFWRRKRMQRFDPPPTPDEMMQMNVVT